MPLYLPDMKDLTPESLKPENESVFDSPMIKGLRGLGKLFGSDPVSDLMPTPLMANVPRRLLAHEIPEIAKKLRSTARAAPQDIGKELMEEIRHWGGLYEEAKATGDAAGKKEFGKRIAELDKIARTGKAYTPSGIKPEIEAPASKVIMNSRVKDALDAVKKPRPRTPKR